MVDSAVPVIRKWSEMACTTVSMDCGVCVSVSAAISSTASPNCFKAHTSNSPLYSKHPPQSMPVLLNVSAAGSTGTLR